MHKIDIFAKNIELTAALREYIEEKIGHVMSLVESFRPLGARVEIAKPSRHHRSGPVFYAEINLMVGGDLLRTVAEHLDLRMAINEAKEELQDRVRKYKGKKQLKK